MRSGTLLLLPATSYVLGLIVWVGAFAAAGRFADPTLSRLAIASFIVLLPGTVLGTFFGVAFVYALDQRLSGRPASARDGLHAAWDRRAAILAWSLLAAGVGAILQALQQLRSEWAAVPLLSWLAGAAWGVLTLFVLPILALEDLNLRETVRRAGGLVRRRWGEGIAGATNLTLVMIIAAAVLGLTIGAAAAVAEPDSDAVRAVYVAGIAIGFLLIAVIAVAGEVLALALYRHAVGRGAVAPFTDDDLDHALVARRRLRRRRR